MYEYMRNSTQNTNHKYCLNYMGKRVSYKKFYDRIDKTTRALVKIGVKQGDVVSICMLNIPESYYLLYAINRIMQLCRY